MGKAMSTWWDVCEEAGPKLRIPEMISQKYQATHGDALKKMTEKLDSAMEIQKALTATITPSGGQSSTTTRTRTLATPDWDGETVINLRQRLNLTGISIPDFEAANQ